ncbi:zinc-binding dehydrogenase [Actinoallomurus bryophytorum]|uniref:Threonine dehydrogenase-like Zn-dependent dehydrogenase n=1 Tax=Actinoallomurus bryophytorum TaxID=1490222 RepID=A0A543C1D0_9ACTN|nr:zinc-binding dehydrogenase [Actinoallomurus bryophytorum]TQL90883.1 threonine dehydrogenase-like Zn-dependent dehydrogenase [Actinoallomurus bryophytorum]
MILALEYHRSPGRFIAARSLTATKLGGRMSGMIAGNVSPLRLINRQAPELPGEGWTRVTPRLSGICGSDLGLLTGRSSPYLSPMTSMPFVPGHEVVGETQDDLPGMPKGTRVVMDPVLSCVARGTPECRWCASGHQSRCDHITTGRISAGLQTGSCADTGGGWSRQFVAHASQLHAVPDELPDERAVLAEPLACAVHSVRRVKVAPGSTAVIIGAGTVGLLTLLALRELTEVGAVYVVAKHGHQQEKAKALGATAVIEPRKAIRALRRVTAARMHTPEIGGDFLLGGVDVAFECTGGSSGLDTSLRLVRAGGTVVVSGMPNGGVDLTPLWYRELELVGAYCSGADGADFADAIRLAGTAPLDGYVGTTYPLARWREAINHAADAGRLGTVKVAFDPAR